MFEAYYNAVQIPDRSPASSDNMLIMFTCDFDNDYGFFHLCFHVQLVSHPKKKKKQKPSEIRASFSSSQGKFYLNWLTAFIKLAGRGRSTSLDITFQLGYRSIEVESVLTLCIT